MLFFEPLPHLAVDHIQKLIWNGLKVYDNKLP